MQRFYERCRCGQCEKRATDLKVATYAQGAFHKPASRSPYLPPPALSEPVRVIGALAVALCAPVEWLRRQGATMLADAAEHDPDAAVSSDRDDRHVSSPSPQEHEC